MPLRLEVSINGRAIGLIGSFVMTPEGRLTATRQELGELGLLAGSGPADEQMALADLNVTYRYDEERQAIDISVSAERLRPQVLGPAASPPPPAADRSLWGAVVNYGLTGSIYDDGGQAHTNWPSWPSQLRTLSLDTRTFGPFGSLSTGVIIGSGAGGEPGLLRLDTTWSWSSPEQTLTYRAGDVLTRGMAWTRSVRLGGAQVQTNFALRPDLVTAAVPTFAGTAAVPSSVDVFINNTRAFSEQVQPGPFVLSNLPIVNGAGTASVVVRDAAGRESVQTIPFYSSPAVLKGGLFDYSIETGTMRRGYGTLSDDYDRLVGSASLRYGLLDRLTLEAHAEGGSGLVNGGLGASFTLLDLAQWLLAVSASSDGGKSGFSGYLALETAIGPVNLHLSTQRTAGEFRDLASIMQPSTRSLLDWATSLKPPRALDIASLSYTMADLNGNVSLSFINRESAAQATRIIAGTYTRPLLGDASLLVSGFHDLATNTSGLFAGISIPIGGSDHLQIGAKKDPAGTGVTADYAKVADLEPGSYGWRLIDSEGKLPVRSGALTYQGSFARSEARVEQVGQNARINAQMDGAFVLTDRGSFVSNRINDAFAIVDVGAPNVDVQIDNRSVAKTGSDGMALVPGLRSFEFNRISINPDELPADVGVPQVATVATPADRGGVVVPLKSSRAEAAAVVVFHLADGSLVPPGARGKLMATDRPFVVGYDGRAYVDGLGPENRVQIENGETSCSASFAFAAGHGSQVLIPRVLCQ